MKKLMTPGPTQVRENVRMARSLPERNTDLEPAFFEEYHDACALLSHLLHTENESFLLCGEGMLGLEAACASLTRPHDRVLVLDNGVFGKGFADLITIYGGEPVLYTCDYHRPIDPAALKDYLIQDHDFAYATLVHVDTPSGVKNDVHALCPLLKQYGILTMVDSVSGMFGEALDVDRAQIDLLCGGSQKALSAPVGLSMVTVSPAAFGRMEQRETPIASFYANLLLMKDYYVNKLFPYTMPSGEISALHTALNNVAEDAEMQRRHALIAAGVRKTLREAGLSLYLAEGFSNNVTAFRVPAGLTDHQILDAMWNEHDIMLAGSFDVLAGKVIRIGHMGENANIPDVAATFAALDQVLAKLGHPTACDMNAVFLQAVGA